MEHLVTTNTELVTLYRFRPHMLPQTVQAWPLPGCTAGIFLDTETTGVGLTARICEIALVPFSFTEQGIHGVHPPISYLQDPGEPIPAGATAVNGITDEMVAGQQADWAHVANTLKRADFVVAHNAKFDRPVTHRELRAYLQEVPMVLWGCSMAQLAWKELLPGSPSVALGALAAWQGFFFSAHRAEGDCLAALYLLHQTNSIWSLYQTASQASFIVQAVNSPFNTKDALKERGYQWDSVLRTWWKPFFDENELAREREWLAMSVYGGEFRGFIQRKPSVENFL
jgi:DNA polymerase-3 subunit epsilon